MTTEKVDHRGTEAQSKQASTYSLSLSLCGSVALW